MDSAVKERETLGGKIQSIFNVLSAIENKLFPPTPENCVEKGHSRNIIADKIDSLENIEGRLKRVYDVVNEIE